MSARQASGGFDIDRDQPITFRFDGRPVDGFIGDTIASALLANGVRIVGRSFKYRRPRGVWGAGVEEPNALADIEFRGRRMVNARATTVLARDGMVVRSVNTTPTAAGDRKRFIDRFARFLPAAFYYKTFIWPDWRYYQPAIRAMAGLGTLEPGSGNGERADQVNHHCDTLVVGAGPAGLMAAQQSLLGDRSVLLVDDGQRPGGSLRHRSAEIDGKSDHEWADTVVAKLVMGGALYLADTTAFGIYDHNLVGLVQRHLDGRPDTLWRVRARQVVLATGAIERPIPFAQNDLPGIMSADAALQYLRRYGVIVGERIVCATTNNSSDEVAAALAQAGAEVTVVDCRSERNNLSGVEVLSNRTIASAIGRTGVSAVVLDDGRRIEVDAVVVSGGWTPTVHLFSQARGQLGWSEGHAAFLPKGRTDGIVCAGAAAGAIALAEVLESGAKAAGTTPEAGPTPGSGGFAGARGVALWPQRGSKGRIWVDFQNDVTVQDIELAVRENFISAEHLKRYTTLGMATDQGKTSNLHGLTLLAELTGQEITQVGTTTYRPPYVPVLISTVSGSRRGALLSPLRRLSLERLHGVNGAVFGEYGGWLRPAYYGNGDAQATIREEAARARRAVALFDGSPLGKIEVIGPQAAALVEFVQFGSMNSLQPGRCRYSLMLSENGVVFDDGIVIRLAENRYVISCSTSHVAAVHAQLEEWRQDRFDPCSVFIHNTTASLATLILSGPCARDVIGELETELSFDHNGMAHMSVRQGRLAGQTVRVARISFTGDTSYELSIRADRAELLWEKILRAGKAFGMSLMGLEALMILRAEKGYIVAGKDTDGTTMPHDLGAHVSRAKRDVEFVGRRSLFTEDAFRRDRRQLVGLDVGEDEAPLATGAHGVERASAGWRSTGFVTSSYFSPVLARPIALALIECGAARHGEVIQVQHLGRRREATIAAPCTFDPTGKRLHA